MAQMERKREKLVIVESELRRRAKLEDRLSGETPARIPTSNIMTLPTFFSGLITHADIPASAPNWLQYVAMRAAAGFDPENTVDPLVPDNARPARLVRRLLRIRYELGMARLSRDQLAEATSSWIEEPSEIHRKLPDVLERYEEYLEEERVCDRPEQMERFLTIAENTSQLPAPYEHVRRIEINGLGHLRELEFQLLSALLQHVEQATVEFSYNPEREEAFSWVLPTVEKFEQAGLTLDTVDPAFRMPDEPREDALYQVREHIFREPDHLTKLEPIPPDPSLRFLEANHPGAECHTVATDVRKRLDNGTSPDEIAVVHAESDARHDRLIEELTSANVPVFRKETGFSPFHPGILTLLLPIETAFDGFDRDQVLDLIRDRLLGGPADIDGENLDQVLREAGITDGSPATWTDRLSRLRDAVDRRLDAYASSSSHCSFFPRSEGQERSLKRDLNRLSDQINPLFDELSDVVDMRTLTGLVHELQRGFNTFDLPSSLMKTEIETHAGRRIYRAISAFRSFLDRMHTGLQAVDLNCAFQNERQLLPFLKQIWNESEEMRGDWNGPADGVRVLTPQELDGISVKQVILVGMNEGQWPAPVHDDAFLNDDLIMELRREKQRSVLRTTAQKRTRDLYHFHQVLSAAEQQVTFTWSRLDAGGTELIPSPFLEDIKKLLTDVPVEQMDGSGTGTNEEQVAYSDQDRLIQFASGHQETNGARKEEHVTSDLDMRIQHVLERQRLEALRNQFFMESDPDQRTRKAGPWSGVLSNTSRFRELLTDELDGFDEQNWSATALERYAQCPYAYFSERILDLEEQDQPILAMDRRREGLLLHEILRRMYHDVDPGSPIDEQRIQEVCDEMLDLWEHYGFPGDPTFWEVQRERLKIRVRKIVKYLERNRSEGQVVETEKSFGRNRSLPAITLSETEPNKMTLHGRIDRIEFVQGDTGAVFDYKNARTRQRYREFTRLEEFGQRSFQIPTYLVAAARSSTEAYDGVSRWKAGYLTLREQRQKPEVSQTLVDVESDEDQLEQIRERLREGTERIVQRILNGDFEVTPDPCQSGCPYRNMCRYETNRSE